MYKKILVPYDKSEPAKNALGAALDLAAGVPGAQITVLSVSTGTTSTPRRSKLPRACPASWATPWTWT